MKKLIILITLILLFLQNEVSLDDKKDEEIKMKKLNSFAEISCIYLVNYSFKSKLNMILEIIKDVKTSKKLVFNKIITNVVMHCVNKINFSNVNEVTKYVTKQDYISFGNLINIEDFDYEKYRNMKDFSFSNREKQVWDFIRKLETRKKNNDPIKDKNKNNENNKNNEKNSKEDNKSQKDKMKDYMNEDYAPIKGSIFYHFYEILKALGFKLNSLIFGIIFIIIYLVYDNTSRNNIIQLNND